MKRKKVLLISIIILLVSLIGGTLSWVTIRMRKTSMILTIGDTSGTTTVSIHPYKMEELLYPVTTYSDVDYIEVEVTNNKAEATLVGLYFRIKNIDAALVDEGFTYAIEKSSNGTNYTLCTTCGGNFLGALNSNRMYILEESINPGTQYYRIYLYIDGESANQATMSGSSVDLEVRATLEEVGNYTTVLMNDNDDLIYKLKHQAISASNSATGYDIEATTDYRYYGVNPNNYVCLDYAGANTCPDKHLYRIIGIIRNDETGDNELKLIKANMLINDQNVTTFSWGTDNDWNSSSFNETTLNIHYLDSSDSFRDTGLSSQAKELLSSSLYYIAGSDSVLATPNDFYLAERGTNAIREGTHQNYFGLLYPSDYGYASETAAKSGGVCTYSTDCSTKNWMPKSHKTITAQTSGAMNVYYVDENGQIAAQAFNTVTSYYYPVVSITSKAIIASGLGTQSHPYTLKTKTLYNVLKDAATIGTYAIKYNGSHQDNFNATRSTEEIYHWYGTSDANGTAIRDKFNVVFADMCWQMIRTTDTGGVRLLYNGLPTTNTVNGKTTYDCGDTRPYHIGDIRSTTNLSGSYYYSNEYTTSLSVSGKHTTFSLVNPTQVTVNSTNASTTITDIAANYPYTCMKTTAAETCTNASFYKVDSQSSGVNAYVYKSTYRDAIGYSAYNSNHDSMSYIGYKYNTRYAVSYTQILNTVTLLSTVTLSSSNLTTYGDYYFADDYTMSGNNHVLINPVKGNTITGYPASWAGKYYCQSSTSSTCSTMYYVSGVDTSGTNPIMYRATIASGKQATDPSYNYLFGDTITSNGDGTFTLSGNVIEVNIRSWYTDYNNITTGKFVCLPGYYSNRTSTCGSTSTSNNINAIGWVSAAAAKTNFKYMAMYKYGNGIELDSGSTYRLKANGTTAGTLQYIYNWSSTATTVPAIEGISTSGYNSLDNSHYTCFNLSGKCSTYYYIYYTTASAAKSNSITGGKYVSTDLTDTNNIIYEMLYASSVNTTDSTIKGNIDTWYRDNLYTNYDGYIDDTIYCNNRSITSFGGWDPNGGSNTSDYDLKFNTASLSCTNTTDKFSQANASAQLIYKVGLISSPEMNLLNNANARKSAGSYHLSSPSRLLFVYGISELGNISGAGVQSSIGVRPSVSLNSGIGYSQGTGAMDDPYVVDAPPINNR